MKTVRTYIYAFAMLWFSPITFAMSCEDLVLGYFSKVPLGAALINSNKTAETIIFAPTFSAEVAGQVINLNKEQGLPKRFIFGDGNADFKFWYVDRTENSPLDQELVRLETELGITTYFSQEDIIQIVGLKLNDLMIYDYTAFRIPNGAQNLWAHYATTLHNANINHAPMNTGRLHPVGSFEEVVRNRRGRCIYFALIGTLILLRHGISANLVNGINIMSNAGHTWIEVGNRAIDPTFQSILNKRYVLPELPTTFKFDFDFRFPYMSFPIFVPQEVL